MIKIDVCLCCKAADNTSIWNDNDGTAILNLSVKLKPPNESGDKDYIIKVHQKDYSPDSLEKFIKGTTLLIEGRLLMRKVNENTYLNLNATSIRTDIQDKPEGITGTLEFYGNIGTEAEI